MNKEEFTEWVDMMHRQNLNGREDFIEAFLMGIEAAYDERKKLVKESDSLPCVRLSLIEKAIDDTFIQVHYSFLHPEVTTPIEHNQWRKKWIKENVK